MDNTKQGKDLSDKNELNGANLYKMVENEVKNQSTTPASEKENSPDVLDDSTSKVTRDSSVPNITDEVQHFTFICKKSIVDKVKAICNKENYTIRNFIETMLLKGFAYYESIHGEATATKHKAEELFDDNVKLQHT